MSQLSGKNALVTGASRGIGAAIAKRLAADGANVIVNYNGSPDKAAEVVAAIMAAGGTAVAIQANVSQLADVDRLFAEAKAAVGPIHILVNNAGVWTAAPLSEITEEAYDKTFDLNVKGPLFTMRAAASQMPEGGRIINISSTVTFFPMATTAVYSGTKAALEMMTKVLAQELGPKQISVNVVAPGTTASDMLLSAMPAAALKAMEARTAMKRLGQPADIADVVAWLAGDDARWVTGQVIGANGGWM